MRIIKILNPESPAGFFELYFGENNCYLKIKESLAFTNIVEETDEQITLYWHHAKQQQRYIKLSEDCIAKIPNQENFEYIKYLIYNIDLQNIDLNDLYDHYVKIGIKEGRFYDGYCYKNCKIENKVRLPEDFDSKTYKSLYSDLYNLNEIGCAYHYVTHGFKERRKYKAVFNVDENSCYINSLKFCPIFINHDCSLTGAPIFLYDFVTYLKNNSIIKNPIIIENHPSNNFNNYNINKFYHYNDLNKLLKFIQEIDPVFIYSNSLSLYFYNSDKFKDYWYKTYFHFHETLEIINNELLNNIKDQKIFVVADKIKKELETVGCLNVRTLPPFIPQEKIFGIENISSKTKHKKLAINSRITIGMSGSLSDRKNPNLFYKLAKTYPAYDFVWIGGSEPDWKYQIPESLDNLKHIPHTNNPIPHFAKLDYFFLTSKNDPCPIVVLENLMLNNRVITIKNNIFYQHDKSSLKQNFIEIDQNEENQIIEAFGSLNLSNYTKDEAGANYIKQNFSEPRIIKNTRKKNNFLIFNFYKSYNDYNDSEIYYFINLINNFNMNNGLSYKVFININIDNGPRKKLTKEKQEFFIKKYKESFSGILNLENIELSVNMGWDLNGLISCINKLYKNNLEEDNQKLAYLHNKSNVLWRAELNKIFYLPENEIESYDTIVSDRFFVECPPEDLNREIMKKYKFFGDLYKKQFKYVQGTIFITRLNNLKTLYDLNSDLQSNLTNINTKNNFWIESIKNDEIFSRYYKFYFDNEHNSPIDLDSKTIVEKGLANNYIDLYSNFGKKGIPDLHFEHALERYIGYLISDNKKILKA